VAGLEGSAAATLRAWAWYIRSDLHEMLLREVPNEYTNAEAAGRELAERGHLVGRRATDIAPWSALAHIVLGRALAMRGDEVAAARSAAQAGALFPVEFPDPVLDRVPTVQPHGLAPDPPPYGWYRVQRVIRGGGNGDPAFSSVLTADPHALRWACDRMLTDTCATEQLTLEVYGRGRVAASVDLTDHLTPDRDRVDWAAVAFPAFAGEPLPPEQPVLVGLGWPAVHGYSPAY
jgi:hypothetical protein